MPFLGAPLASQTGRATKNNSMGDRNLNGETGSFALPDNGMGIENSMTQQKQVPIAICGMGMRLPGSINNASALYDFLLNKKDARGPVPKNRFNNNGFYSQYGKPGTLPIDHGYWLDQIDLSNFDGSLFSMSSAEIEKLDPQQRLLLEVVWEAFENAGETGWRGSNIGCYVGSFGEEWNNLHVKDSYNSGFHWITGCMDLTQANRISYEYDLKGPSMTVRVGCSAAGLCLHLACQAIQLGECNSAVVAGSSILLSPQTTILMWEGGALSPDASCKTFDANANGYARADGVNCLYIKRLDHAIRDGNPIRAIVRSTSTNCDGKSNSLTVPNIQAHEALIRSAYESAGLDPSQTAMVECHGTGTAVGDAIEAGAVARVFGEKGVYLGAVKPNLGHTEGASAITSIMKAILELENHVILPNIKFETPNPKIPWGEAGLKVPTTAMPWPDGRLERISVNSYGIGGTNIHIVLDSAASYGLNMGPSKTTKSAAALLLFSAGHEQSLRRMQQDHYLYSREHPANLDSLAYTLATRREHLPTRGFCITDGADICTFSEPFKVQLGLRTLFVFTGQGAQWAQMGKELLATYPDFLRDIKEMDKILQKQEQSPAWTLEEELLKPADSSLLNEAEYSQPVCTALQIALVNLLKTWNVIPSGVIGHSSGEIAAAFAAGAITMEEAIIIAYYRGVVSKRHTHPGGMAVVGLGRIEVSKWLISGVTIACENSSSNVTISGDVEPLQVVLETIKSERPEVFQRRLHVEKAYHSHHMHEVGDAYHDLIDKHIQPKKPTVPFFSSVTAKVQQDSYHFGARYWQSNLENPVLFYQACKSALSWARDSDCIHVEIGPHSGLAGPLRQIYVEHKPSNPYVSVLTRGANSVASFLACVGELHCRGLNITYPISHECQVLKDLPTYPWNYQDSYWNETRVMKNSRLPRFPSHDLLGMRTIESSDLEPAWRNVLRLRNVSWLRDHCIGSDIVFPASGYIALVGEAVRQLTDFNDFTVRDMSIKTAMVLDLQQPIEVITNLRPYRLTDSLDSDFFEFSIQTHNGTTFTKHCTGLVGGGRVSRGPDPVMKTFPRVVDERRWYKTMANVGLRYGPRFTGLEEVSAGATESAVSASICERRDPTESPYAMHPTSMDLVLQSCVVAAFKGQPRRFRQPVMPTFIEEVYVRGGTTGEKIRLMSSTSTRKANNGGQAHSYGVDTEGQLVYFLKGLRFSPLDSENQVQDERPETAHLVWKPHVDYLDATSLITPSNGTELARMNSVNERIFLLCAIEAANSIEDIAPAPEHLEKYRTWLLQQVCRAKQSGNPFVSDTHELSLLDSTKRQELIESTLQENIATSMASTTQGIVRCYKHMQSIFKSDIDPLELMQRDDLLASFYDCLQDRHEYKPFLQLLGHLHPQMKVLEIGAGTGGLTAKVLAFLQSEWGDHLYHEYTYTDISAGFFVKAKERFQNYASIKYDVLDITRDPKEQGFPTGHYDLIIASNVLHATPNLQESLLHVRSLLKPDGRLLLQELCAESKWVNFVFGLFPGWWLGAEDGRVDEPYVTPEEWDRRLREAGFAGIDAVALDAERQCQVNAMMITRPTDPDYDTSGVRITLLSIGSTHPAALDVESQLIAIGYGVDHVNWGQEMPEDQDIISFIDIESAFFDDIPGDRLRDFLETVEKHSLSNIIWLTQPAQISPRDPRFAQALGMARTLRSELGLSFTTIEMQDLGPGSSKAICDILQRVQKESEGEVNTDFDPDYEYVWSDRTIQIGRMHWFAVPQALTDTVEAGSSRTLDIGRRGLLHTLRWVAQPLLELPSDEVRIKIQSVGLNFRDLVGAMGVVDGQEEQGRATLGIDSAGVITAVGREVTELKAGDRVMVFSPSRSSLATDLQIPSRLCAKIPGSLSAGEACTMPTVYVTVLRALRDKANIQRGQTLLVHSAAGGVGIAALYYAQWIGAEIYTTVSSEEKASFLAKSFGIPRENIFHSRDSSFVDQILASTRGRGVDVVLNSLSGELLHASWRCVAADGCMVEIGKRDIVGRGRLAMDPFLANRSFIGVDVATIPTTNIDTVKKLLNTTIELYENGVFQPIQPITRFEADHVEDALRYLQRGKHIGKVVVNFPEKLELPLAPTVPAFALRSDKTYLLVGGMGGIGMAIARWMVEHGAKHLAFLSRSAGQKEADKALVAELAEMGCNVMTFAGDVCDSSIVRHIVSTATAPIAGVLQLAMVLADTGVLMMDIDKWNTAVQPKVQGTWNLHNILPADLDFFVMASSLSGICGYWGQSNYAAGNTFLDAFAQYRRGLEMAASTIDLGAVGEVGFVSRNAKVREKVQTMLSTLVSEQSLLDCVQLAILRSQPVTGISTNISTKGYYNSSQLLHGLVFDASNDSMMIWKRDPRMALSRSLEATRATSSKEKSTGDDGLKAFLMTVQDSPRILDQPSSAVTLAREISRRVSIFMMRGDDDQVDLKLSLPAFGVDSLISIEIRNWWRQTLGVDVSVLQLISGGSFADLGKKAVEQLREKYSGK